MVETPQPIAVTVDVLAADSVRELIGYNPGRPVVLAESGAVEPRHTGPFRLYAADKAGTGGGGDGIDLADAHVGLGQHLADESRQDLDMGAGGDFRNDPAERTVRLVLANDRLRQNLAVGRYQRGGTVVAGGFKAQNECHREVLCLMGQRSASAAPWIASSSLGRAGRRWRWRRRT